jgi:hypothetical protein
LSKKRSSCASGSCFRERVCALHLDRVFGGKDEERLVQRVPRAADGDGVLLHRLEQGALGLRRGAVDLVRQHHLPEDGAAVQLEAPADRTARAEREHVHARHVARHQIGRELDAGERKIEAGRKRPHEQRLPEPRVAFEQHVPTGDEAPEHLVHDLVLTHDDCPDRGSQPEGHLACGAHAALELSGGGTFLHEGNQAIIALRASDGGRMHRARRDA